MHKNLIYLLTFSTLLVSCSRGQDDSFHNIRSKDTNSFDILIGQFANNIDKIWGIKEVLIAGPKDYVRYSDQYYTRSHINFESGWITLATIMSKNPAASLRKAIINTLLTSGDPDNLNIYSDTNVTLNHQKPLLYGQVLDNTGHPICNKEHAASYADYLIKTQQKCRHSGLHLIWSVTIPMVSNHLDTRIQKYLPIVHKVSERYGVSQSLILAIMQIESSFNQYAVSDSDALGLMQVMRKTAAIDVFRMKGKWGKPSRRYLLDPENNIDTGVAYLSILQSNYLSNIINPISRRYAVIAAYHSGAGSVLRVFSSDKNCAFRIINQLSSSEVYYILRYQHPASESRRYLYKVNDAQKYYYRYS
ncbi:membrane-bound lytic murein transglycosylase MltC [Candidatus Erwinia haradaeae]|uniref:Membrane-bound lytic murein transglycosylase C n=1 Tax=Candidatus Erwinia haradaeae TaxID=1922217 RepID=A0A803FSZ7_9GAMM|nr:membrane-bound lytic murein transglycosylase MltC [Candidatus Erwinia haradaeae]VFP87403.1 Membrane-bound lytic murein transglycosylase C [Candidatus Erwinia haradaeae]